MSFGLLGTSRIGEHLKEGWDHVWRWRICFLDFVFVDPCLLRGWVIPVLMLTKESLLKVIHLWSRCIGIHNQIFCVYNWSNDHISKKQEKSANSRRSYFFIMKRQDFFYQSTSCSASCWKWKNHEKKFVYYGWPCSWLLMHVVNHVIDLFSYLLSNSNLQCI